MLTLSQLLVYTESARRTWRTNYIIDALETRSEADNLGEYLQYIAVIVGGKEPRKSALRLYAEKAVADATAKVSCSCPYFRIRLAPVLYMMGATDLNVRPEDIPEKYRGQQQPGLCPHLLKLSETILSPTSTEMRRLSQQAGRVSVNDRLRQLT